MAIDPAWRAVAEASRTAIRLTAKGGAPNALFVAAALETLPHDLLDVADELRVVLPWGSLLRAVWAPEPRGLRAMRLLCQPGASLDVVVAIVAGRDGELGDEPPPELPAAYLNAGFDLDAIDELAPGDLRVLGTTWAKRLADRSEQRAWRVRATAL